MEAELRLFWSGAYFSGLFLLWLSFYFIIEPVKKLELRLGKPTHWKYILLALVFLLVRPAVDAYFGYFASTPAGDLINFASVLAVLMGSLLVFIPIANLAKRSLSESIGLGTWLFYLQVAIVAFYFSIQTPSMLSTISSATYFIAALILGLSLRLMSNFAEEFEIMFPLRWMFDTAAWVLPLALAIRAYGASVAARFESIAVAGYVAEELKIITIFLIFVCGLISFIAAYTLKKTILEEPARTT